MDSLKKMIKSWLDDTYPEMPGEKRTQMAENMDCSLIEVRKEESMKTFYEINNVVRMSFIEMQYMKKVSLRNKKLPTRILRVSLTFKTLCHRK